ncbi:MAG: peptidase family protein, partial [Ilumatobacteraceae bacterium]|nr:peptidase family protein [Ilumatobacteraceae bacterium]
GLADVAGVESQALHARLEGGQGQAVLEVDVGHDRHGRPGDDAGQRLGGVLVMLASVNVFVGLLNLFPILPFDGGHAAIATYERLRSRKGRPAYRADVGKMVPVALGMMGLLAFLMLAGLYLDIAKPIG